MEEDYRLSSCYFAKRSLDAEAPEYIHLDCGINKTLNGNVLYATDAVKLL